MVWPFKRKPKPETPQVAAPVEEGAAAPRTTPETIPRPIVQEQVPQARAAAELLQNLDNLPLEERVNRALQAANQMRRSLARASMDIRLEIISQTNGTADFSRPETLADYSREAEIMRTNFDKLARIEERLMARPRSIAWAGTARELMEVDNSIRNLESALATKFKASAAEQMRQLSQKFSRLLLTRADDETRKEIAGLVGGSLSSKISPPASRLSPSEAESALKALIESGILLLPTQQQGGRARDFLLGLFAAQESLFPEVDASRFIMRQMEFGAINRDALALNTRKLLDRCINEIAGQNPTDRAALERLLEIIDTELRSYEKDTIGELGGGRVLQERINAIEDGIVRKNVDEILDSQDGRLRALVEARFALEAGGKPPSGTVDSALERAAQVARAKYKVVVLTVAAVAVVSGVAYLENKFLPEHTEMGKVKYLLDAGYAAGVGFLAWRVAEDSQRHWVTDEWQLRRVMQILKERAGPEKMLGVGVFGLALLGFLFYDASRDYLKAKATKPATKPGEQEYSGVQKFAYGKLREKYGDRDNYSEYRKALDNSFGVIGHDKDKAAAERTHFDWETIVRNKLKTCEIPNGERVFTDREVEEIIKGAKQTGETEQSQKTKDDWIAAIGDTDNGLDKRVRGGGFVYFPSVGDRKSLMKACIAGVEDAFAGTNNPTKADVRAQMETQLKAIEQGGGQLLQTDEITRFLDAIAGQRM